MTNADALIAVQKMSMAELRSKHEEVLGETTTSRDRSYLLGRLLPALREQAGDDAFSTVSNRARTSRPRSAVGRDARLPPPGAVLRREFRGRVYEVTVLESGFRFDGKEWASLTPIAREITGTPWNGFLFFHLSKYPKRSAAK